jgi:hypothetical protein
MSGLADGRRYSIPELARRFGTSEDQIIQILQSAKRKSSASSASGSSVSILGLDGQAPQRLSQPQGFQNREDAQERSRPESTTLSTSTAWRPSSSRASQIPSIRSPPISTASPPPPDARSSRPWSGSPRRSTHVFTAETVPWQRLRRPQVLKIRGLLEEHYQPATANRMLSALRGALRECWQAQLMTIEEYQTATIIPPVRGESEPRGHQLSADELRRLFEACGCPSRPGAGQDSPTRRRRSEHCPPPGGALMGAPGGDRSAWGGR